MDIADIGEFLQASLDDVRLSRGERKVFKELLDELRPNRHNQELLFHHAFQLAKAALKDSRDKAVVDWLDEVVKVLRPAQGLKASGSRVAEAIFFPDEKGLDRLVELIEHTRSTLDICVFTFTHNRLAIAVKKALRRGVKVRLLTDIMKVDDRGSDVRELDAAGVNVRTDHSPTHMHHKFAIIDDHLLLTGSFNWTRSAVEENQENILVTDDPLLLVAYSREFNRLWEQFG